MGIDNQQDAYTRGLACCSFGNSSAKVPQSVRGCHAAHREVAVNLGLCERVYSPLDWFVPRLETPYDRFNSKANVSHFRISYMTPVLNICEKYRPQPGERKA